VQGVFDSLLIYLFYREKNLPQPNKCMKVLMISGPLVEEMQSQVDVEIIFNVSIEGRDPLEVLDGLSKTGSDWELVFENDPPELANAWGYADIICRISRAEQCGKTIIIDNVPVC